MKEIEHRAKEVAKRIIYHRENSTLSETQAEVIILEGLTQTRLEAIESCAVVAENAFMDGVFPKHTAVRDFISYQIRTLAKKESKT